MRKDIMSPEQLAKSLAIPDLSDPANGVHAVNLMLAKLEEHLANKHITSGWPKPETRRSNPITSVSNNFDRLLFPADNVTRSSPHTRYISETEILRGHMASMIPDILAELPGRGLTDYLVMCPGICYRRDVVDRIHCGEPHQLDIWRIRQGEPRLGTTELKELVHGIATEVLPHHEFGFFELRGDLSQSHPYLSNGFKVRVLVEDVWLSFLEGGEIHPEIFRTNGLEPSLYSGLALGIILDRLVMIAKKIDDIRILRSPDPRIQKQMLDLEVFRSVSKYPAIKRDLSLSVAEEKTAEDICEAALNAMGSDAPVLEEVTITSETRYADLPPQAIERLGIKPGQKNVLVRLTLRSHERSLTQEQANQIRDTVYQSLNESGTAGYLASQK